MEKVHYGDTAFRKNNKHACGAPFVLGDKVAFVKKGGTADRDLVTCTGCQQVIVEIEKNSFADRANFLKEQKTLEKAYYGGK